MNTFLEYWNIEKGGSRSPKVLSVYAGRFQPFHYGHYQAYLELCKTFDQENCFIVTADIPKKMNDPSRYPFRFNEKEMIIKSMIRIYVCEIMIIKSMFGIPDKRIIFDPQPYTPQTLLKKYDPDYDILVVGLSEKDMAESPRFTPGTKKDGNPTYFQMFKSFADSKPLSQHGYIHIMKEYQVDIIANLRNVGMDQEQEQYAIDKINELFPGGQISGTNVRNAWLTLQEADRKYVLMALYGSYNQQVENLFNKKIV